MDNIGEDIHGLASQLFPICRSITGGGVRKTLDILARHLPGLTTHEVPTGTQVLDWTVPKEWNVSDAYVLDPSGNKIIDFAESNLHLVGYSIPINAKVSLAELREHLYSLPEQPDAIPYITSYYKERWGFCVSHNQLEQITEEGEYTVVIDSELKDGHLTYAELLIPGEVQQEVFLSTYICHPSMGNNELSGPTVTTYLCKWLLSQPRKYSYRIVFIPETIGSLTYLSRNLADLKERVIAGYNINCVGDNRSYSYLPSRSENSLSDKVALHVLGHEHPDFIRYSFLDRGSDERQYCAPNVDLPIASVMRTKFGAYPEYHTSLDDLALIEPEGLFGAYKALRRCLEAIEINEILCVTVLGEPQLGKRGLYPTLSTKKSAATVKNMMNLIAYCDGTRSLLEIAEKINVPIWELEDIVAKLREHNLLISNPDGANDGLF